jgi:hypothetical protein
LALPGLWSHPCLLGQKSGLTTEAGLLDPRCSRVALRLPKESHLSSFSLFDSNMLCGCLQVTSKSAMASVCSSCTSAGSCKCTYGKPGDECSCGADCKCPSCPKTAAAEATTCASCVSAGSCSCTYGKPGDVCSCGEDCKCAACPKTS